MLITMCPSCAAKLRAKYSTDPVTAPRPGACAMCNRTEERVTQYEVTKKRRIYKPAPSGPPARDRRARYKGSWRDEE